MIGSARNVGVVAVLLMAAGATSTKASNEIVWGDSFEAAQKLAKDEGKLMLVDFWKDH